jgi:magnesium-transporting ATPase (P-type)
MVLTFLLSILAAGIAQSTKLIMRMFKVTKVVATKIVFAVLFVLCVAFTLMQQFQLFSGEQLTALITMFTTAIGSYELFLNKTGLDGVMKDALEVKRGNNA